MLQIRRQTDDQAGDRGKVDRCIFFEWIQIWRAAFGLCCEQGALILKVPDFSLSLSPSSQ